MTFGIYIKTFKPDYHLAKALIASLRRYCKDVPIIVIPDDGFAASTIWGERTLVLDDNFARSLTGYYKKLWVFLGPFDRFLYLDADMLCLKDPAQLIEHICELKPPFFAVCRERKIKQYLETEAFEDTKAVFQRHIGDLGLLAEFDSEYDIFSRFPFNSGLFASTRDLFSRDFIEERFSAAMKFQAERGFPPLTFSRQGVFMSDQGFLNYLVAKQGVDLKLFDDVFVWGGRFADSIAPDCGIKGTDYVKSFVHWAGCRRPSLFDYSQVPWGNEWKTFYRLFQSNRGWGENALCRLRQLTRIRR